MSCVKIVVMVNVRGGSNGWGEVDGKGELGLGFELLFLFLYGCCEDCVVGFERFMVFIL